jgi:hypothetical protein
MELEPYVTSLRSALAAAGQAAADDVREAADRLSYAVEPSLRLTFIDALSDAAAEITTQLDGVSIDVRMRSGNPELIASDDRLPEEPPAPPAPPEPPLPPGATEESMARISLRLPESLKSRVEEAAATEGLSTNAWIARALSVTLESPQTGIHISPKSGININVGRRFSGWAR